MRISKYIKKTRVLGPGIRFAVWFQGCKKRCVGCINPEGRKLDGGIWMEIEELMELIKSQKDIHGVTISGGEPFLQFAELREFTERIKQETSLDIMLYSGYTLSELEIIFADDLKPFLEKIDLFIDGGYIKEQDTGSLYRGSDNQNIYCFSGKFEAYRKQMYSIKNRDLEFEIEGDDIFMIGVPPKDFYPEFLKRIGDGEQ